MALAPLFPLVPGFWTLLLLQLVSGAAVSFAWSGAQTLIAQLAEGDAGHIGRFSFFARFGSTTAPILAGAVWDYGGAWPAYLLGALWGGVLTIALVRTPEGRDLWAATGRPRATGAVPCARCPAASVGLYRLVYADRDPSHCAVDGRHFDAQYDLQHPDLGLRRLTQPHRARWHDDWCPVRDRRDCERPRFALRRAGHAVRRSATHDAERHRVVDIADCRDAASGWVFALLLLSQAVRGWLEGVIQPVILSVQARAVGRHQQGAVVGLRQTGQRLTSIVVPPLMGGIADRCGVSESFFILGGLTLVLCLPLALMTRRAACSEAGREAAPTPAD